MNRRCSRPRHRAEDFLWSRSAAGKSWPQAHKDRQLIYQHRQQYVDNSTRSWITILLASRAFQESSIGGLRQLTLKPSPPFAPMKCAPVRERAFTRHMHRLQGVVFSSLLLSSSSYRHPRPSLTVASQFHNESIPLLDSP